MILICFALFSLGQIQCQTKIDSLQKYLLNSQKGDKYSFDERISYALKAKQIALVNNLDSLIIKTNLQLSSLYRYEQKWVLFKKINDETLDLATKTKDSSTMAFVTFNIGDYFDNYKQNDSAYYYYHKTEKLYKALKDDYNTAYAIYSIAVIQKDEKDFIGS